MDVFSRINKSLVNRAKETLQEFTKPKLAKKARKPRRAHDQYPTEPRATEVLLEKYPFINGLIYEPCAGAGGMADVMRTIPASNVITNDLIQSMPTTTHFDAKTTECYANVGADWIISNPPYSEAFEIIKEARKACRVGCAFLLRITFLEPTNEREEWLKANPPNAVIILPRMSFTGDKGTDMVTVQWVIWDNVPRGTPAFQFVSRGDMRRSVIAQLPAQMKSPDKE